VFDSAAVFLDASTSAFPIFALALPATPAYETSSNGETPIYALAASAFIPAFIFAAFFSALIHETRFVLRLVLFFVLRLDHLLVDLRVRLGKLLDAHMELERAMPMSMLLEPGQYMALDFQLLYLYLGEIVAINKKWGNFH